MAIMPLTHEEARRDLHTGRRWLDNKALAALDRGTQILRVHDVAQTCQARLGWMALNHVA